MKQALDPHPSFTTRLLPGNDEPEQISSDGLLPLLQHWTLALLLSCNKTRNILEDYHLRRLLKVGKPEYWRQRDDYPICGDDEDDAYGRHLSFEERLRLQNLKTEELLNEAKDNLARTAADFAHPLFHNLSLLGELLGLSETDKVVLCVLVLINGERRFSRVVSRLSISIADESQFVLKLASMTRCSRNDLNAALRLDGALRQTGLLELKRETRDLEDYFELADGLTAKLLEPGVTEADLVQLFFTPRKRSMLGSEQFDYLGAELRVIAGILQEALRQGIKGTNVLLYGPPGVGKTELASVVVQMLNAELYEVGYADKDGDPIRGAKRLRSYHLCQRLLSRRRNVVVLFDEIEDMLEDGEIPGKAWVNRTLEENPVPAIWITNQAGALDPAYRRRFDYSVHIDTPPRAVRKQIVLHHLRDLTTDLAASEEWLDALTVQVELSAGQIERAAKVARLVEAQALERGDVAAVQSCVTRVVERSARLLGQAKPRKSREMATAYDLAYLHTDVPMADVLGVLQQSTSGSFCFYGPPGTGKTALARHIAHTLGLPAVVRRASDLLSPYVGEAEQNIAKMFKEASAEPCVLILDEADSFLQSRAQAKHSWEITQVNELLTQMEDFDGLFICTTNLLEKLDAASLRRFDWKIAFWPMTAAQRWAFFLQEFHLLGADIQTAMGLQSTVQQQLNGLTPGDFAPVTRQFRLMRSIPTAQQLFERLYTELLTKQGGEVAQTGRGKLSELPAAYAKHTANKNKLPLAA